MARCSRSPTSHPTDRLIGQSPAMRALRAQIRHFEAGALTDAKRAKLGLFEAASGGTLFLDEIDALPVLLQSKLLNVIEEKRVRRLGAVAGHLIDVKLIAATQTDLSARVREGRFRTDMRHRLAVVIIELPFVRARGRDVLVLARHFLCRYAEAHKLSPKRLSRGATAWLLSHEWPGNVCELSHLMERATLLRPEAVLDPHTLEHLCQRGPSPQAGLLTADGDQALVDEHAQIRQALIRAQGNVMRAARLLGEIHSPSPIPSFPRAAGKGTGNRHTSPSQPPMGEDLGGKGKGTWELPTPAWEQKPVAVLTIDLEEHDDGQKTRDKLARKVPALDPSLEDTLPYLFSLLAVSEPTSALQQMDPQIKRRRTFEAIKRLLLRASLDQPLLQSVEDLHGLDSERQDFLTVLSEGPTAARALLLVTYRPEYQQAWSSNTSYTQLRLQPLGREEAEELLTALLGVRAEVQGLKQLILAKSEGNPFFLEEIVQALVDQGVLVRSPGAEVGFKLAPLTAPMAKIQLPRTVQGVLAACIDRLPAEDKALVQTAPPRGTTRPRAGRSRDDTLEPARICGVPRHGDSPAGLGAGRA